MMAEGSNGEVSYDRRTDKRPLCININGQIRFAPGTVCIGRYDFPGKANHVSSSC